ncbi:MAG: hypothetical protein EOP45_22210 [Sphingobacteriaceae bacterium]|nr:MAG: hypothetical protein EOP45_22210 [Sphingobacteriaceae bacterium]
MKSKNWFTIFLIVVCIKSYGQEIRVNNSFIILVNDKLVRTVAGLKLITSDANGKDDSINGGYYPGVLYVSTTQMKNLIYADSLKNLIVKFDYYEYLGKKQVIHNYEIEINRKWFKESLIIVKIFDIKKKQGTYNYTFEVPGVSFGKLNK